MATALVSIKNASNSVVRVTFSNKTNMYDNGQNGSDFGPLTSEVAPGQSLPAAGGITRLASTGGGKAQFRMEFAGPQDRSPVAALNFVEESKWEIDNGNLYRRTPDPFNPWEKNPSPPDWDTNAPSTQRGGTVYTVKGGAFKVAADVYPAQGSDSYVTITIYSL